MSLTKIFFTCNSFAHSQNNKADTKHPRYLSMVLVFLCVMTISRRASGGCKSEKNEMLWEDLYILWIFYCLWFDLKIDSGFPDRFFREALKEPKGESKRGAKRGSKKGEQKGGALSFALFSINKVLLLLSIKWNHFWKKGFFINIMEESFLFAKKLFFLTIGCC